MRHSLSQVGRAILKGESVAEFFEILLQVYYMP